MALPIPRQLPVLTPKKKKQKKKERHSSVMAARETNTIPARYLGKVGRQVSKEDENEKPALLYTIVGRNAIVPP